MLKNNFLILMVSSLIWLSQLSYAQEYVGGNFQLKDSLDTSESYCFDLFGFGMDLQLDEVISARTCKNPGWPDTTFRSDYPNQGQVYAIDLDLCVQAISFARGAHLKLQTCSNTPLQRFFYSADQTVRLRSEDNSRELCVVVNPAAGIPMDGAGLHLRRELYLYECGRAELPHAQWLMPEGTQGVPKVATELNLAQRSTELIAPGQAVYISSCSRCHGVDAQGKEDMQSPKLAGMSSEYIKTQFYKFINGQRGESHNERWAAQMSYYVKTLPERNMAAIDDVVSYISMLPESELEQTIAGNSDLGEQIYTSQCMACHGEDGLGVEALQSPRLTGIQDWYILKQLEKYRDGRRGSHPDDSLGAQMQPFAKSLSNTDINNVTSYINQLSR